MLMKIRYGYGEQTHLEKREILHSWYSDLRSFLPILCKPQEYTETRHWNNKTYAEMMEDARVRLYEAREQYDPIFEGLSSCNPQEKDYMTTLDGLKEVLDEITAIAKIIDKASVSSESEVMAG